MLTDSEKDALVRMVIDRLHAELADDENGCDCPLHRLSEEERAARIDKAIEETEEQIRRGELPGLKVKDSDPTEQQES